MHLSRTNQELQARLAEERDAKQAAQAELEALQKTFRKANDQLKVG